MKHILKIGPIKIPKSLMLFVFAFDIALMPSIFITEFLVFALHPDREFAASSEFHSIFTPFYFWTIVVFFILMALFFLCKEYSQDGIGFLKEVKFRSDDN